MNYRIETKEAFCITGISAPLDKEIEHNFMVVPKMWQEASVNGTIQKLAGMMDTPLTGLDTRIKEKEITEGLMDEKFKMFMETVDERFHRFVNQINEYLTENGCKCDIKLQKSGYVVSYVLNSRKRTLATFVSRKTGMKLRIYPEHIQEYQSFLDTLPEKLKKEIKKASVCKRLVLSEENNSYIRQFLEKELETIE